MAALAHTALWLAGWAAGTLNGPLMLQNVENKKMMPFSSSINNNIKEKTDKRTMCEAKTIKKQWPADSLHNNWHKEGASFKAFVFLSFCEKEKLTHTLLLQNLLILLIAQRQLWWTLKIKGITKNCCEFGEPNWWLKIPRFLWASRIIYKKTIFI